MTREVIKNIPKIVDLMLDSSIIVDSRIKLRERLEELCKLAIKALDQQPCEDCVSRQAVLSEIEKVCFGKDFVKFRIDNGSNGTRDYIIKYVKDMPPVQPEQKMGHWIDTGSGQECSLCREIQYGYDNFRRFCASCGAKMKESEDNMKYKTIDNPCYHCYTGAIGECAMIGCEHLLNSWSQDLESETIEILNTQAEGSDKE